MADDEPLSWDDGEEEGLPILKPKVTLIGDRTVGKTTLLSPYLIDPMDDRALKTFGFKVAKRVEKDLELESEERADSYMMLFEVDGDQLEDMTDERLNLAMGGSAGVLVMADSLHMATLEDILYQLDKYFEVNKEDRPIILAANKVDVLDLIKARIRGASVVDQIREELKSSTNPMLHSEEALRAYMDQIYHTLDRVDPEELLFRRGLEQMAEEVARRFGAAPYIFLSAATGRNVDKVFRRMAKLTAPPSLN